MKDMKNSILLLTERVNLDKIITNVNIFGGSLGQKCTESTAFHSDLQVEYNWFDTLINAFIFEHNLYNNRFMYEKFS